MPNTIDLLKQDHRNVEQLFSKFQQTNDYQIVKQICQELTVHTQIEEELLYPLLRKQVDTDMAQHAEHEHNKAKHLITQIQQMSEDDTGSALLVKELEEAISHHVQEEENSIFPKMEQQIGTELDKLTQQVISRKKELTSKAPHSITDLTKEEISIQARESEIQGRSSMSKEELAHAVEAESGSE